MADHRIALLGAPDASLADPQAKNRCIQAMQLNLTGDVVEELLDCIKSGKRPQVLFGSTPVCDSCSRTRILDLSRSLITLY
jgi:hypothetical protein